MIIKCNSCQVTSVVKVDVGMYPQAFTDCPSCLSTDVVRIQGQPVGELCNVFNAQGHSGASAAITAGAFFRKAMYKGGEILGPPSTHPEQWTEVADDLYQSKESSSVFFTPSEDKIHDNDFAAVCDVGRDSLWSGRKLIDEVFKRIGFEHTFPYTTPDKCMIIEIKPTNPSHESFSDIELDKGDDFTFRILRFPS